MCERQRCDTHMPFTSQKEELGIFVSWCALVYLCVQLVKPVASRLKWNKLHVLIARIIQSSVLEFAYKTVRHVSAARYSRRLKSPLLLVDKRL
jgi:hypothetical protein